MLTKLVNLKFSLFALALTLVSFTFAMAQTDTPATPADTSGSLNVEYIVTTIIGFLVTLGVTEIIKRAKGLNGLSATLLSVGVSLVVALVAVGIQMLASGSEFSGQNFATAGLSIFMVATVAYRTIQKITADEATTAK